MRFEIKDGVEINAQKFDIVFNWDIDVFDVDNINSRTVSHSAEMSNGRFRRGK